MPGPEPAESRRRSQTPKKLQDRIYLPSEGRQGAVPTVPLAAPISPAGLVQWLTWWRSPMATQWREEEDVYPLARLLLFYEAEREAGPQKDRSAEMRQLEARFGLDPRSRKELCWVIGEADGEAPTARGPTVDEVAARRDRARAQRAG